MASFVDECVRSFPSTAALAKYRRVKVASDVLAYAGSTDTEIGTVEVDCFAGDEVQVPVRLRNAEGTALMVASGVIAKDDPCYAAANGKVASSGTILIGKALGAAGADGDVIEVVRVGESSAQAAAGGTTAAAFLVDSDATIPKIELASYVGGTGDYKVTIKPAATLTGNRVLTVPDATDTVVTLTGTQTLTNKTLTTPAVTESVQVLAAAGSVQGDAGAVTASSPALIHATGADATKGIVLPAAAAGLRYMIKNADAANAVLKVYPASGDAINALSANAAISMAAKTCATFYAVDGTTWFTCPLLPS